MNVYLIEFRIGAWRTRRSILAVSEGRAIARGWAQIDQEWTLRLGRSARVLHVDTLESWLEPITEEVPHG